MTPTKSQEEAIERFKKWLPTSEKHFTLRAGAGRGKSWVTFNGFLPAVVNEYKNKFIGQCTLLATTNQACDSLKKLCTNDMNVTTVHKFLAIRPTYKKVVHTNPEPFKTCGYTLKFSSLMTFSTELLIIDEAYRLDQVMLDLIDFYYPNARIVFIGDPYQTPPIGLPKSPIEDLTSDNAVTLNETPRFKKFSPLANLVDSLLLAVQFKEDNYLDLLPTENEEGINIVPTSYLRPLLNTQLFSNKPIDYSDFCILTATRKKADDYNNYCVQTRAKAGCPIITQKEPIIVDTVVAPDNDPSVYWIRTSNLIPLVSVDNNTHNQTKEYLKKTARNHYDFLVKVATPLGVNGNLVIYLLSGDGGKGLSSEQLKTLWAIQRDTMLNFVFIRPTIAKTIHMAQGITSSNVFIDMGSIHKWSDDDMKRRLLYTGISRCSENLYLMR